METEKQEPTEKKSLIVKIQDAIKKRNTFMDYRNTMNEIDDKIYDNRNAMDACMAIITVQALIDYLKELCEAIKDIPNHNILPDLNNIITRLEQFDKRLAQYRRDHLVINPPGGKREKTEPSETTFKDNKEIYIKVRTLYQRLLKPEFDNAEQSISTKLEQIFNIKECDFTTALCKVSEEIEKRSTNKKFTRSGKPQDNKCLMM